MCRGFVGSKTLSVCARDVCVGGGEPTVGLYVLYGRSSLGGFVSLVVLRADAFKVECDGCGEMALSEGFAGVRARCNGVAIGLNCCGNRLVEVAPRCRSYGGVSVGGGVPLGDLMGGVGCLVGGGFGVGC